MKHFLAIFTGSSQSSQRWSKLSKKDRALREMQGIEGWGQWIAKNKNSIVDMGSPIGRTKKISLKGITKITNNITGYTVVKAKSHAAAAKMFKNHPHFSIFPGEGVEVMECLPIPEL